MEHGSLEPGAMLHSLLIASHRSPRVGPASRWCTWLPRASSPSETPLPAPGRPPRPERLIPEPWGWLEAGRDGAEGDAKSDAALEGGQAAVTGS